MYVPHLFIYFFVEKAIRLHWIYICLSHSVYNIILKVETHQKILKQFPFLVKKKKESKITDWKNRELSICNNGVWSSRSRWFRELGRPQPRLGRFSSPLWLRCPGIRGSLFLSFLLSFLVDGLVVWKKC